MVEPALQASMFWNSIEVVDEFSSLPAPEYWREFFLWYRGISAGPVLDLGCGAGRNASMLVDLGFKVVACDLHSKMIVETAARLRQRNYQPLAVQANIVAVPFADNCYESVLSNGVIHNAYSVNQFRRAISEMGRVLRTGGILCLSVFTNKHLAPDFLKTEDSVYATSKGLTMVLLSPSQIIGLLSLNCFEPLGTVAEYVTQVSTGKRSVLRGAFRLKGSTK